MAMFDNPRPRFFQSGFARHKSDFGFWFLTFDF
jgi:hypothetical protein